MTIQSRGGQTQRWRDKKANPNKYKLREGEREEVQRLVRSGEDVVDVMYLTSSLMFDAVEIYRGSLFSKGVFNLNRNYVSVVKFD